LATYFSKRDDDDDLDSIDSDHHFNSFPISLSPIFVSCLCKITTLACTFHGIIGVQDAYAIDKKKMDGYVPLPLETEESAEDLHVTVFAFRGGSPPPEDGIYFINACIFTVTNDDETNVEMYHVFLQSSRLELDSKS